MHETNEEILNELRIEVAKQINLNKTNVSAVNTVFPRGIIFYG